MARQDVSRRSRPGGPPLPCRGVIRLATSRPGRLTALAFVLLATLASSDSTSIPEPVRIQELLELREGVRVADVGAGDGEWSETLARLVGSSGHVYSTEIDEDELLKIRTRIEESDLRNVTALLGRADDTMLPDACCDAILLRMVFHHMDQPEAMMSSLRRSIRSAGRLLIIEQYEHYGHGVAPEILTERVEAHGFRKVLQQEAWNDDDHYAVLFRTHGDPPAAREP